MKAIPKTIYQCEVCKHIYETEAAAVECEAKPVTQDRGVKVGDEVRILTGDGKGQMLKVTDTSILDHYWGHYFAERYWHTVCVTGDVIGGYGSRMLTFDAYALAEPGATEGVKFSDCARLSTENASLVERVKVAEANARRYEWLRNWYGQSIVVIEQPEETQLYGDKLDAAIDAAITAEVA